MPEVVHEAPRGRHLFMIYYGEIKKIDLAKCKEPRETISKFWERQEVKPDYIMNAGFFNADGTSSFTIIDEGKKEVVHGNVDEGIAVSENGRRLVFTSSKDPKAKDFITAFPTLVKDGVMVYPGKHSDADKVARTAIGFGDDRIYLLVADATPGMSLREVGIYMKNVGCKYAINLDGGGSSRIHNIDNKCLNNPTEDRAVDSVFAIYLNKEPADGEVVLPEAPKLDSTINNFVTALTKLNFFTTNEEVQYWDAVMDGEINATPDKVTDLMRLIVKHVAKL